ncbi:unnamed protein product [Oikopleura dioica]|uniref:Glutathione peroxidase n=1 Tax=Oikopleura dioica TaxID=34765 RepID=E4XXS6_OIKDI|nr:unnamed protein product [Oikopleura dioica]
MSHLNEALPTLNTKHFNPFTSLMPTKKKDFASLPSLATNSGKQEPASDEKIAEFVKKYNFQGELFQKIEVNGKNAHPLWAWMKTTSKGKGTLGNDIKWNFTKFVVDRAGQVVDRAATTTSSAKLAPQIEKLLQSPFE